MTQEMIGRYVQPEVANDVGIRKARTYDAQNPKFQGFSSGAKAPGSGSRDYRMGYDRWQGAFLISILPALNEPPVIFQFHIVHN